MGFNSGFKGLIFSFFSSCLAYIMDNPRDVLSSYCKP